MSTYVRQTCPSCGREGRVREENLGLRVRCKQCGTILTLSADSVEGGGRARLGSLGVAGELVHPAEMVRSLRAAEQRERLLKAQIALAAEELEAARREIAALADRADRLRRERDEARARVAPETHPLRAI